MNPSRGSGSEGGTALGTGSARDGEPRGGLARGLAWTYHAMPHLTGLEFIGEATRIRPGMATLMITGRGASERSEVLVTHGVKRILPKPYDVNELRTVLRDLLPDATRS